MYIFPLSNKSENNDFLDVAMINDFDSKHLAIVYTEIYDKDNI